MAIIPDGDDGDPRRRPAGATSTLPIQLDDGIVVAAATPGYWRYCDRSAAQSVNNSSSGKPTSRAAVCTSTSFDPGSTKTNCPRSPRSENCRLGPDCSHT